MRKLVLAVVAVALIAAPTARGEVRTVTANDPQDATPTLSGIPNDPDIRRVTGIYDSTAGSLMLTVEFYNALNALDTSQNYKFWSNFDVGEGYAIYGDPGSCGAGGTGGDLYGQHNVIGSFYDRASMSGFDGYLYFARTESADHKSITISAASPALANRNYRCLEYSLHARTYSSISNIYSEYDAGCDCWYLNRGLDTINGKVEYGAIYEHGVWFDGQQPPPVVPPPPTPVKGKLRLSVRGGCHQLILNSWTVGPWANGAQATGMITAKVGRQVKEFAATRGKPVRFRAKPGRRTIHVRYTGDASRSATTATASTYVFAYVGC